VSAESAPERIKRPRDDLGPAVKAAGPVLFPEVQVSRQFAFHVLQLPDELQPTWHRWLEQAFDAAEEAGYDHLTMVIGDTQYQLSLLKGST